MRSKSVVLLVLALGCGLVASIGISQVMERRAQNQGAPLETQTIFIALTDINTNDLLTPQNVKLESWPKEKAPQGSLTKLEELEGKRTKSKIFAGEPILSGKLMGANDSNSAGNLIPPGYRAVAVRVDAVSASGSLILPGDRVDVLVYMGKNPSTGVSETMTKTILTDIKVFAVDTAFQRYPDKDEPAITAKTISLLLTPKQAEKVILASEMGSIRLVLRGPDADDGPLASDTDGTRSSDFFGPDKSNREMETKSVPQNKSSKSAEGLMNILSQIKTQQVPAQAQTVAAIAPSPFRMVIFRGTDKVTVDVDETDEYFGVKTTNPTPNTPRPTPIETKTTTDINSTTGSSEYKAPVDVNSFSPTTNTRRPPAVETKITTGVNVTAPSDAQPGTPVNDPDFDPFAAHEAKERNPESLNQPNSAGSTSESNQSETEKATGASEPGETSSVDSSADLQPSSEKPEPAAPANEPSLETQESKE